MTEAWSKYLSQPSSYHQPMIFYQSHLPQFKVIFLQYRVRDGCLFNWLDPILSNALINEVA
jgi:hypothetical protein